MSRMIENWTDAKGNEPKTEPEGVRSGIISTSELFVPPSFYDSGR